MDHIHNLADVHLLKPSVVTIGVFDGVHRGHQHLIRQLVSTARQQDRLAVVLTFFPHPDIVLRNLSGRYYLNTPEQRAQQLGRLGVDYVVTHPFNDDIRQIRAADFVDLLVSHLRIASLWVGTDFALGYQREGNVAFLTEQGQERGFDVQAVELVQTDDRIISSSTIRQALDRGDVAEAAISLGRPYTVTGTVVHGEKRGRKIGFPTANVDVWPQQIIPAIGVYACTFTTEDDQKSYPAVTNIGVRPTFAGTDVTVEAHLLDFDGDLYGQPVRVSFIERLRGEKKFNGINELTTQIQADVARGRAILQNV